MFYHERWQWHLYLFQLQPDTIEHAKDAGARIQTGGVDQFDIPRPIAGVGLRRPDH